MNDVITNTPTLNPEGLFTRWGGQIVKIHGIGSGTQGRDVPEGPPMPDTWWVIVDVYYQDEDVTSERREYHPSQIVWRDDDGEENHGALLSAVMFHLRTHGRWKENGDWVQTQLKAV